MNYWSVWFIGIAILIINRIIIFFIEYSDSKKSSHENIQKTAHILTCISIFIVGGIPVGKLISLVPICLMEAPLSEVAFRRILQILLIAIVMLIGTMLILGITYYLAYLDFYDGKQLVICLIVFLVASIVWTIPMWKYNSNKELVTQTQLERKQEMQLVYFCGIPVSTLTEDEEAVIEQSENTEIIDIDNINYWYMNEKNECVFDRVSKSESKIIFVDESVEPYVLVETFVNKETTINNNDNTTSTKDKNMWTEYTFYLPEEAKKYSID